MSWLHEFASRNGRMIRDSTDHLVDRHWETPRQTTTCCLGYSKAFQKAQLVILLRGNALYLLFCPSTRKHIKDAFQPFTRAEKDQALLCAGTFQWAWAWQDGYNGLSIPSAILSWLCLSRAKQDACMAASSESNLLEACSQENQEESRQVAPGRGLLHRLLRRQSAFARCAQDIQ